MHPCPRCEEMCGCDEDDLYTERVADCRCKCEEHQCRSCGEPIEADSEYCSRECHDDDVRDVRGDRLYHELKEEGLLHERFQ